MPPHALTGFMHASSNAWVARKGHHRSTDSSAPKRRHPIHAQNRQQKQKATHTEDADANAVQRREEDDVLGVALGAGGEKHHH